MVKYMEIMKKRREQVNRLVKERKKAEAETQYIKEMRRLSNEKMFRVKDLVFLDYEGGSMHKAPLRKLKRSWIGSLKIHQVLDKTHYIVSDWDEKLLSPKIHVNRLKRCIPNLQEIDEKEKLNVASNVRDLFCKWEEVAKSSSFATQGFAKRDSEENKVWQMRGKDVSV